VFLNGTLPNGKKCGGGAGGACPVVATVVSRQARVKFVNISQVGVPWPFVVASAALLVPSKLAALSLSSLVDCVFCRVVMLFRSFQLTWFRIQCLRSRLVNIF
jgi:hypothetical protein